MVAACTAGKGTVGKVASFVGKVFVVQRSTTKTTNICPTKITSYMYTVYSNLAC